MTRAAASYWTAQCEACDRDFQHPDTGPRRRYCPDPECRRRRHARAGWTSYQKRLEAGIDPRLSPAKIAQAAAGSDFSQRFRDHDPVALYYETVVARDPCSYCGSRDKISPDHITAWIRGGQGDWENLTAACRACNSSKGDRTLLLWLLDSPRLRDLAYRATLLTLDLDAATPPSTPIQLSIW